MYNLRTKYLIGIENLSVTFCSVMIQFTSFLIYFEKEQIIIKPTRNVHN